MDIDTFVKGCMRMKGPATSIDMLSMGYEVTLIHRQNRRLSECIRPPRTSFGRVFQGFGRLWGGVEERVRERERETARLADDVENVPQVWRRRLMKSVIGNGKFTHCLRHWH